MKRRAVVIKIKEGVKVMVLDAMDRSLALWALIQIFTMRWKQYLSHRVE
jgi:hypothetical protein